MMEENKKKKRPARTPTQGRGIETRRRIVGAARELFEEKGYHHTNSKEIAARAGVAIGTFYGYFNEKKSLFLEIISEYYEEVATAALDVDASDLIEEEETRVLVRLFVRRLLHAHTISPLLHREILAMLYDDSDVQALVHEKEEVVIQQLLFLFESLRDQFQVRDLEAAIRVIHRATEEIIHNIKIFGSTIEEERLLKELEDMLYCYLFLPRE